MGVGVPELYFHVNLSTTVFSGGRKVSGIGRPWFRMLNGKHSSILRLQAEVVLG